MNPQILITLLLIALTLYAFVKEIAPSDLIALTVLCLTVILGLLDSKEVLEVFKNEAPVTIGALFIIGTALEKSGGILQISQLIQKMAGDGLRSTLLLLCAVTQGKGACELRIHFGECLLGILLVLLERLQLCLNVGSVRLLGGLLLNVFQHLLSPLQGLLR